jgi:hypothetical protein
VAIFLINYGCLDIKDHEQIVAVENAVIYGILWRLNMTHNSFEVVCRMYEIAFEISILNIG